MHGAVNAAVTLFYSMAKMLTTTTMTAAAATTTTIALTTTIRIIEETFAVPDICMDGYTNMWDTFAVPDICMDGYTYKKMWDAYEQGYMDKVDARICA